MNGFYWKLTVESLTDKSLHIERDNILGEVYAQMVRDAPERPRTHVIRDLAERTGLSSRTVRDLLANGGHETALPSRRRCGKKSSAQKTRT